MSIQIERLSKELDLLKKSNSNTKEVDDKIMKLSLEILKREKIKKKKKRICQKCAQENYLWQVRKIIKG